MQLTLPEIQSSEQYKSVFKDEKLWQTVIRHLCDKHELSGSISRATRGSHIVYRVGDVWVKLMAPIYASDMKFEIAGLQSVSKKLSVQTPEILYSGHLDSWPYVVLSHVPGERIGAVFSELSVQNQISLAVEIASVTKEISRVPFEVTVQTRCDWNQFIQTQFDNLYQHHKARNLPGGWLSGVTEFISKFDRKDFMSSDPCFLHSDLTYDHFLLTNRSGIYEVSAVIDFADCRVGHREYEMPASAVFIFKENRSAMQVYVQEMKANTNTNAAGSNFSEKLMAWTLLHQYSDLNTYFSNHMTKVSPGDFSELSKLVFPF